MPILQANEVYRDYRMGQETVHALNGVSVSIASGEFVAILGTSGSGKSTLLNLFGGLDRPNKGEILFRGESLSPFTPQQMAHYRLKSIGMIFQSFNLIPTMTASQNIALALAFAGMPKSVRESRTNNLLSRVGLAGRAGHRPSEMSGGEQQRVSIARALANEPEVLLADEPTGNLDSTRAREILELLKGMQREGKTIIMVTHDADLASRFADRTIRLRDGKVESIETASEG